MKTLLNIVTATTFVIAAAAPVHALTDHRAGVLLGAGSHAAAADALSRPVQLAAASRKQRKVKQGSGQASGKRTHQPATLVKEWGGSKKSGSTDGTSYSRSL